MVLVDTCIWSEAFRKSPRPASERFTIELRNLIMHGEALLLGPIRQETLSGIRSHPTFQRLAEQLRAFEDFPLASDDFETAADHYNICRTKGIQGSNTDFLLCAVSTRHSLPIFTTDKDFELFSKHLKIRLHSF